MNAAPSDDPSLFQTLTACTDSLVFITETTGRMVWANQAFVERTGYTVEDFWFENKDNPFIHPDDMGTVAQRLSDFVASDERITSQLIRNRFFTKWGQILDYVSNAAKIQWQGQPALLVVTWEATNREEDRSYAAIVEGASDGIIKLSADGRFLFSNRRFHELVHRTPVELKSLTFLDLVHPEDRERSLARLQQIAQGSEGVHQWEVHVRLPNGEDRFFDLNVNRLIEAKGDVLLLALIRDTTEARRAESEARDAQRLASLGVLAGGIAHDYNNLMTGVLANASWIESMEGLPKGFLQAMEDIRLAASRAASLSTSLLAYAGKAPRESSFLDLSSVTREMIRLVTHLISRSIVVESDLSEAVMVNVDLAQTSQVIMNLIINAADAIGQDPGTIQITSASLDFTEAQSNCRWFPESPSPGRYARLQVIDSGSGIPPDRLAQIFEPFFTTKAKGRGMGLSAILGIIQSHGGAVGVTSTLGQGTCFEILFPLADPLPNPEAAIIPSSARQGSGRVLVVDDEEMIRTLVQNILEYSGYRVTTAENGHQALEVLGASDSAFDVVIVDRTLPGMKGDLLTHKIRNLLPNVALIHASGYRIATAEDLPAGTIILDKPFTSTELVSAVHRAQASVQSRSESSQPLGL